MINLSAIARKDHRIPLTARLRSLRDPNWYGFESIEALNKGLPNIKYPKYQRASVNSPMAFVYLLNVGITSINEDHSEFSLYDKSGSMKVAWGPHLRSFEQCRKEEGLTENDRVFRVEMRYFKAWEILHIVDIKKFKHNGKRSALDRLGSLPSELVPLPRWAQV